MSKYIKLAYDFLNECDNANDAVEILLAELDELKARNEKLEQVVKLTVDDLRMRADDGVINIIRFIWDIINELNEVSGV